MIQQTITNPKLSVAIPTHGMKNSDFLFRRCLDSLWNQSFQDFEIVVTDNSDDDSIQRICEWYRTGIRYIKNKRKGMAQNTNEAIKQSKGEYIKILYMDDYMAHDDALEKIVKHLSGAWLVTGCTHIRTGEHYTHSVHLPSYSEDIYKGQNTIGSPSVLTIKNDNPIFFDEEMTWMLDCDYYKRLYDLYGEPTILKDINVIIGLHGGQMTHIMGEERKLKEFNYMIKKYE
jgi:glycosyltransferase involved in cell wall biosynthesis